MQGYQVSSWNVGGFYRVCSVHAHEKREKIWWGKGGSAQDGIRSSSLPFQVSMKRTVTRVSRLVYPLGFFRLNILVRAQSVPAPYDLDVWVECIEFDLALVRGFLEKMFGCWTLVVHLGWPEWTASRRQVTRASNTKRQGTLATSWLWMKWRALLCGLGRVPTNLLTTCLMKKRSWAIYWKWRKLRLIGAQFF